MFKLRSTVLCKPAWCVSFCRVPRKHQSPGGKGLGKRERALIKQIIKEFCPRFAPGATVVYIGDAESKFLHLEAAYLKGLGVVIAPSAKMPDVVVHDTKRNWLLLAEAVTSAGPVDWKRRNELKDLFKGCKAGLLVRKGV